LLGLVESEISVPDSYLQMVKYLKSGKEKERGREGRKK
jgi:hypothetical protein